MADPDPELDDWIDEIAQPAFWTALCPRLGLAGAGASPLFSVDEAARAGLWNDLLTGGFFQLPPMLPAERIAAMAAGVLAIAARDIPPVFAYVFDEFWQVSGWTYELLCALLGAGCQQVSWVWVWCLDPSKLSGKGWGPHRDREHDHRTLLPNGLPRSLSLWVPLTDVTPENGCIYVLPTSRDANFREQRFGTNVENLQDIVALPARAGSVLGWNHAMLHWGGRPMPRATTPRISLSNEYARAGEPQAAGPTFDPREPPAFRRRLAIIGQQLVQYSHMYADGKDLVPLGQRLQERFA